MGASTAVDRLVALARQQASVHGDFGSEDAAEAVVPRRRKELLTACEGLDLRHGVVAIPGEWDAVRRWLVLTVAAHLDAVGVEA